MQARRTVAPADVAAIARALVEARGSGPPVHFTLEADETTALAMAYAIQRATLDELGPIGGWKVGRAHRDAEPSAAPLPAAAILASPARHGGGDGDSGRGGGAEADWGLEVELAVRLGDDLPPRRAPYVEDELKSAVATMLPTIEVLRSRLADWAGSGRLVRLADLQSHAALVCGAPRPPTEALEDLGGLVASLVLDGQEVARVQGGNPAGDVWRVLTWLANHASRQGLGLQRGQVLTTGSCIGIVHARAARRVHGAVEGLGEVTLTLDG